VGEGMAWWVWLVVAFAIGIIEVTTLTFVLLWIAIGAFVTALLTPFVTSPWVQLLIFAVVSIVLLVATRPLSRKWKQRRTYPARTDNLIGETGVVVTEGQPGAFATVRVKGDLWSARSDHPLRPGQTIVVVAASSTVLTVDPKEDEA
jgi:membrane protein implicated in regulation of membrane protease activity